MGMTGRPFNEEFNRRHVESQPLFNDRRGTNPYNRVDVPDPDWDQAHRRQRAESEMRRYNEARARGEVDR